VYVSRVQCAGELYTHIVYVAKTTVPIGLGILFVQLTLTENEVTVSE